MIENPILEFFIKHEFIIEIFLAACFFLPWKDRRKFWYLILPAFILLSGAFGYIPNCPEIVYYLIIIACIFFYSLCSFKLDIMQALFYTVDIYALQFCISSLYYMVIPQLDNLTKNYWISHIIKVSIAMLIIYLVIYFLIVRKKKYKKTTFQHPQIIPTSIFGLFIFSCLSVIYKWDYQRFFMKAMTLDIVQILFSSVAFFVIVVNDINCRNHELSEEQKIISEVALLTTKPIIYAANMSDEDFSKGIEGNKYLDMVKEVAAEEHAGVLPICAQIEEEIVDMDKEEKEMFLSDLGLEESGLDRLIKECYSLLGLISFLTAGKPEVRAWTIKKGTKAPQAAGKIHTDFERGFIRAEIVSFDDLMECGSIAAAKEKGLYRSEGKEYVMKDGDVVLFRFNV